jgi:hypothetical protein
MNLPGVRTALDPKQRQRLTRRVVEPSTHERASIYLLLAEVLSRISKLPDAPEAKKVSGYRAWGAGGVGGGGGQERGGAKGQKTANRCPIRS